MNAEAGEKETIPLLREYDSSTLAVTKIEYVSNRTHFKAYLPRYSSGTPEEFLSFLQELKENAVKIDYNTWDKEEKGMEQLLSGQAQRDWSTQKQLIQPGIQDEQAYRARILAWKQSIITDPSAIENQKTYMLQMKKFDKFTVPQYWDRISHMNLLIQQFPNATAADSFSHRELKRIFFTSMPARWKTNFINAGLDQHNSSVEEIKKIYDSTRVPSQCPPEIK